MASDGPGGIGVVDELNRSAVSTASKWFVHRASLTTVGKAKNYPANEIEQRRFTCLVRSMDDRQPRRNVVDIEITEDAVAIDVDSGDLHGASLEISSNASAVARSKISLRSSSSSTI